MFCPNCGKETENGAVFCSNCGTRFNSNPPDPINSPVGTTDSVIYGAPVNEPVNTVDATSADVTEVPFNNGAAAAKTIDLSALVKNKTVRIAAIAVVAVIVLTVIIACIVNATGKSAAALKGDYYLFTDGSEKLVYYNGTKVSGTDLSSGAYICAESADGSKAVLNDDETLYYLSDGKISEITDDFDLASYVSISFDGSTVVYVSDDVIYTYKNGKSSKAAGIENDLAVPPVVSPNGDTIVFADVDGDKIKTYAYNNGKVTDLDAKIIPFAVSNGGSVIYGLNSNSKLCYIANMKADSVESVKSISLYSVPVLSSDNKQILFNSDNGVYYFDTSLDDAIKVTSSSLSIVYPEGCVESCANFKSFIAYSDGKVIRFTLKSGEFNKETIVSNIYSQYRLSADGKKLLYLDIDELYSVNVSNPDNKEKLAESIYYGFDADKNLKNIYFVDRDNTLRYVDGKSSSGKKIIDDVERFAVNSDGVCVFTDEDDTLYYSTGGSEKKKAGVEDVNSISDYFAAIYVRADDELYVSTNGKTFTKS